jgi:hypothetical protein
MAPSQNHHPHLLNLLKSIILAISPRNLIIFLSSLLLPLQLLIQPKNLLLLLLLLLNPPLLLLLNPLLLLLLNRQLHLLLLNPHRHHLLLLRRSRSRTTSKNSPTFSSPLPSVLPHYYTLDTQFFATAAIKDAAFLKEIDMRAVWKQRFICNPNIIHPWTIIDAAKTTPPDSKPSPFSVFDNTPSLLSSPSSVLP